MWAIALKEQRLDDYNDFPIDNTPSMYDVHTTTVGNISAAHDDDGEEAYILPSKFYNQIDLIPTDEASRISSLRQLFSKVESRVSKNTGHVYKMACARILQLVNELDGIIDRENGKGLGFFAPQSKAAKKKQAKDDSENKSPLDFMSKSKSKKRSTSSSGRKAAGKKSKTASGASTKKRGQRAGKNRKGPCPYCRVLCSKKSDMIRFDHDDDECTRIDEYTEFMNEQTKDEWLKPDESSKGDKEHAIAEV